jgi:hypothetical protein
MLRPTDRRIAMKRKKVTEKDLGFGVEPSLGDRDKPAATKAAGPRRLATAKTGNYDVVLVDFGKYGEEYGLLVEYTGDWGNGEHVDVRVSALEEHVKERAQGDSTKHRDAAARDWFQFHARGDLNIKSYLELDGYDYGTSRR